MAKTDPRAQPLSPQEREFVHLIVHQGLKRKEAFAQVKCEKLTDKTQASIKRRADNLFYRPRVYNYYQALMEEVRDKQVSKAVWTKEVATEKLMKLIERAEQDLYGDEEKGIPGKQITMSRLNAIVLPAKELNLMHGFNNTNVNMNGGVVVQFVGEDDIPD